ncbi:MAG: J domain-containing protein [Microthrixaceae bacterium]
MRRDEALGILGLSTAEAKDFAAVRSAYHRRMRAVHPDLNSAPDASEAAAMVSAAYDMLDRAYRTQKNAREVRRSAEARRNGDRPSRPRTAARARVLSDTTITVMGSLPEAFALARRAGAQIGEVSSADESAGLIVVMAEFLHAPPCQVTLGVVRRGDDRAHVRCSVEVLRPARRRRSQP